mgnify:CR=1 FL=1
MNINQEYEAECETFIDTLFPYLLVACFLLGIFIMRIKNNFAFGKTNFENKKNFESTLLKFDKKQKEKDEKF